METFASNFAPLGTAFGWLLLLLISLASLIPSGRANLLGPLFALPSGLGNLCLDRSIAGGYGMGEPSLSQWVFFFAPFIFSALSIGLWTWKVRRRH